MRISGVVLALLGLATGFLIIRSRRDGTWTDGPKAVRPALMMAAAGFVVAASATIAEVVR